MEKKKDTEYLYETVANDLAALIGSGTYRPGDRLPSVRALSGQKRISVSTALQAYLTLESRGLIESRPQSGYYVRTPPPNTLPEPEVSSPRPDPAQVSLSQLVMMVLRDTEQHELVQLGTSMPNTDLIPTKKLFRIIAGLEGEKKLHANAYIFPPGYELLRVQIAKRALNAGCSLSPDEILITTGCMEAVELCLRAVCQKGDIVAIESPTYFGLLQSLEALGLQALEIPTHPRDGVSLDALEFALEHNPVKACLLVPNFNNPLGSCMPDENKREVVKMLARRQIPLIENDVSGEIYFSEKRPLTCKSFDQEGLVMWCSSFSKDISPGFRLGWTAPGRFYDRVAWLKFVSSGSSAAISQVAVAEFLVSGGYEHTMRRIRREYVFNVERITQAVKAYFPAGTRLTRPGGGIVLWVQLPENGGLTDSLKLYKAARQAGITIAPGYLFSATDRFAHFIRLCTSVWGRDIERAIARLGELVKG